MLGAPPTWRNEKWDLTPKLGSCYLRSGSAGGAIAKTAERFLEASLRVPVGAPVPAPEGVLAPVPRVPGLAHQPGQALVRRAGGGLGSAAHRATGPAAEDRLEGGVQRLAHGDLVAVSHDHPLQLGDR